MFSGSPTKKIKFKHQTSATDLNSLCTQQLTKKDYLLLIKRRCKAFPNELLSELDNHVFHLLVLFIYYGYEGLYTYLFIVAGKNDDDIEHFCFTLYFIRDIAADLYCRDYFHHLERICKETLSIELYAEYTNDILWELLSHHKTVCINNYFIIIEQHVKHFDPTGSIDEYENTILSNFIANENYACASLMIETINKYSPECMKKVFDMVDVRQQTAINLLAKIPNQNQLKLLKTLQQYNPDLAIPDREGNTPLHNFALRGNVEAFILFLEKTPLLAWNLLQLKNKEGLTPLDIALLPKSRKEILQLLDVMEISGDRSLTASRSFFTSDKGRGLIFVTKEYRQKHVMKENVCECCRSNYNDQPLLQHPRGPMNATDLITKHLNYLIIGIRNPILVYKDAEPVCYEDTKVLKQQCKALSSQSVIEKILNKAELLSSYAADLDRLMSLRKAIGSQLAVLQRSCYNLLARKFLGIYQDINTTTFKHSNIRDKLRIYHQRFTPSKRIEYFKSPVIPTLSNKCIKLLVGRQQEYKDECSDDVTTLTRTNKL